jgi:hypothetical protein
MSKTKTHESADVAVADHLFDAAMVPTRGGRDK